MARKVTIEQLYKKMDLEIIAGSNGLNNAITDDEILVQITKGGN